MSSKLFLLFTLSVSSAVSIWSPFASYAQMMSDPVIGGQEFLPKDLGVLLPGTSDPMVLRTVNGKNLPMSDARLSLRTQKVKEGDSVWTLSEQTGFRPNADMLAALRALNPGIDDLSRVRPGDEIVLMYAARDGVDLPGDDQGFILVDADYRSNLSQVSNAIDEQTRFASAETAVQLSELQNALSGISISEQPLPGDFMAVVRNQADLARNILLVADGQTAKVNFGFTDLSSKSPDQLQNAYGAAFRSVEIAADAAQNRRPTSREISVPVFDEATGTQRCRVSVWWASEAEVILEIHQRTKTRLTKLSTPAEGSIPVSISVIWAEWQSREVSERVKVDLSQGTGPLSVDLLVKSGGDCS